MNPNADAIMPENASTGWDVGAWRVGLIGGNLSGLSLAIGVVLSVRGHSMTVAGVLAAVSILVSFFILPGVLSGIARRLWLVWAYLPLGLLVAWLFASVAMLIALHIRGHGASAAPVPGSVAHALLITLALPLSTSVPVCLTRWVLARNRARQAARLAFEQSQFTMERVGVWPPPPTDNPR